MSSGPEGDAGGPVLHVTQAAQVGGLERVVQALVLGHHRRGHEVRVAALAGREGSAAFSDPLRRAGVPVDCTEVSTYSVLSERRFVRDLCRRYRPRVVHTHGYRPDIVDGSIPRRLAIPTVSTEHGTGWEGFRGWLYERLQFASLRSYDAVVAVSRPIASMLEDAGIRRERIHLIPNTWTGGVEFLERREARRRLGLPADACVVGWVGRMIEAKGCDLFLRALAGLAELSLIGAVIGDGPHGSRIRALAESLALGERVRFLGEVSDAAEMFRAFDVFVMSSRSEGSPIVLLEAMAAGVPVVATRVGGLPDMVGEQEAHLVSSEDAAALAAAIRTAAADPAAAGGRALRARRRIDADYAIEPWLDRYWELYARVARRDD